MEAFASYNDARLYKLFRSCADPQSDLRTLIKSRVSHAGFGSSEEVNS